MLLIPAANILLEVQQFEVMPFVLMGLVMVALIFFLRMQVRHAKQIKSELNLLKSLEKHNVEYEFVLGVMRLSIWHLDTTTGQLTFEQDFREKGNKYFSNADGMTFQETIMALDSRDADRVNQALIDLCEGRRSSYHEMYRVKVPYDNSVYWEESYATVADRNADGKPTKIIGTTMRIDDRKAMEEALVQARNRAEESDRLKTAFIANMSHEIRTPLNAIVGFTSLLPDITDDAERQGLLDLVNENTQKLLRIVDDVVSISKIESGQEQLVMTTFDLNNLLIEVMNYFASKVNPNVEMKQSFAQESLTITTDMIRLSTIAKHLVSNATKFTTQGIIEVGYDQPQDGRVVIWVRDTGKGIAEENLERIFERFFKVDEFVPGAGLGLSICRVMAYSLGGEITVDSKLGEGSVFRVSIPI
ncbi:ATP-binding protein [Prevotella sp. E15-22]|uniref:sensor histidine kinase n=1 Tax=Prevotella sp. E15-22 TaxID=2937774 RepID=UPI002054B94E|nr:HAMP domain-containing sensor histidine kinase [Prevotella sp. E15-22]UPS43695.1 ATP-binding protein [Prevotella sp. E15-22]